MKKTNWFVITLIVVLAIILVSTLISEPEPAPQMLCRHSNLANGTVCYYP